MELDTGFVEYKLSGDVKDGGFTGRAAGIGNMDRGGDVIAPGAFTDAIAGFLKNGSILVGHDWEGVPVAMPTDCHEEGSALMLGAKFHSTEEAQNVRTVVEERQKANLSVGLSIGFTVAKGGMAYFENGDALLAFCEQANIKVDRNSVAGYKGYCRLVTKIAELFEVSIVTVPMNPACYVTRVKSTFGGDGSLVKASLNDHFETVLAAVDGLTARIKRYSDMVQAKGDRPVSEDRLAQADSLYSALGALLDEARRKGATEGPEGQTDPAQEMILRARRLRLDD